MVGVRQARAADSEAVAAFTEDTWDEREDYLPEVFPDWVAGDGDDQRTVVATADGSGGRDAAAGIDRDDGPVVGCCQVVRLSGHEAWTQGMRVHPDYRGAGVASALDEACRDWAREQGATVARNMVFSWNEQGLAAARSIGYDPRASFRWARPDPDPDAGRPGDDALEPVADPDAVWSHWQRSDARDALAGLALDDGESWALSELTRERCRRAADERAVLGVRSQAGTRAGAVRTRTVTRDEETTAVYGAAAWADLDAARALFARVARDAADCGADATRVLVPETPRHVSDAAAAGVALADHPDLAFEADLTGSDTT